MSEPTTTPDIPAALVSYLAVRDQQRADDVQRPLDTLTPFERRLIREAAVMAYVRGSIAGRSSAILKREDRIPKDSAIVAEVIACCHGMSDLYPLLAAAADEQQSGLIAEARERLNAGEGQ